MLDLFRRALRKPLELVLCSLLVAMVAITFSQVVSRYVLHISLSWSEELARFLLMWLAMLSAAYGFKTGAHFALVFVVERFNRRIRRIVNLLVVSAVSLFLVVFIVTAVQLTLSVRGNVGSGTQLSMAVPYSSAVVGGVLMLYYLLHASWRGPRPAPPQGQGA